MTIVDMPSTARPGGTPRPSRDFDDTGSSAADPERQSLRTTEVALAAVSVAAVVSLVRLFSHLGYLVPTVAAVVVSQVLAAALRRLRVPTLPAVLVGLGALTLFVPLVLYPETTRWALPGTATWDAIASHLSEAWEQFGVVKAPTEALDGFVLALVVAAWVIGTTSDLVAFRLAGTWEALVPAGSLFVFASALAADRWRIPTALAFLGASVIFVLAQRGLQAEGSPGWLNPARRPLAGVLVQAGAVGVAIVVAAATVIGPALPGAGDDALLDAYDGGDSNSRVTLSPLVDIRSRLTNQSDVEAFQVVASAPAYWRLTALDTFDGRTWTSDNRVETVDGSLPGRRTAPEVQVIEQSFTISGLDVIWLPAAYRPVGIDVRGATGVSYDAESGSLVTADATAEGQTYAVRSEVPRLDAATLAGIAPIVPDGIARTYLSLPDDFPDELRTLAAEVTVGATGTYEQARMLQDWFRSTFTYDLTVRAGHGESDIERFLLDTRAGYCEQFAGSFAALARTLGIPARVAVGFTPGEETDTGAYVVRGRNAHAWPEVWFAGIGWVPFEPTPQRGIPGAEEYTGLAAQQDPTTPTTAPSGTTVPADPGALLPDELPLDLGLPTDLPASGRTTAGDDGGSPWPGRLVVGLVALALLGAAAASVGPATRVLRRRRRLARVRSDADRVRATWEETVDELGRSGVRSTSADTPREVAARAVASRVVSAGLVEPLAKDATTAQWDPEGVGSTLVDDAQSRLTAIGVELRAPLSARERLWRHVDPRTHRARVPSARRAVREPEHHLRH